MQVNTIYQDSPLWSQAVILFVDIIDRGISPFMKKGNLSFKGEKI
jgi:hypothetical protein